jgi:regulatory protein
MGIVPDNAKDKDAELCKIKSDALRLLSFSPRSVAELKQRLKIKRYPDAMIEEAVVLLTKQGLLNDEQFARLYTNSRIHTRPVGRRQLETELKRKGLAPAVIQKSLEELSDYDEKAAARELVARRFENMTGISNQKKKARLFGFLKRRGFSQDVIFAVLEELFRGNQYDE